MIDRQSSRLCHELRREIFRCFVVRFRCFGVRFRYFLVGFRWSKFKSNCAMTSQGGVTTFLWKKKLSFQVKLRIKAILGKTFHLKSTCFVVKLCIKTTLSIALIRSLTWNKSTSSERSYLVLSVYVTKCFIVLTEREFWNKLGL